MTTPYTTGTISLTNGSAVVTGIGTAWQIALIKGGIVYPEAAGNGLPIATVDSDTQITAAVDWTGATGTYSYALVRDTAYDAQIAQNAEALARLLAGLEAGTIWKYDMSGDTAGRDIYDGKPKGFSYLDVSQVPAQLWVKASNTEGDWAGPHSYGQGAQGEPGPVGAAANVVFEEPETGLPGTDVEMDVTGAGTTGDPYHVTFTIPRGDPGQDGTGTGDVVGPASATDGHLALFDGLTGKVLKDGGAPFSGAYADLSGKPTLGSAAALNVGVTAGTVAAGDDPRFSAGGSSKNEAIFALEIADLKGARLGMVGGVADAFDDESGVATKTNAIYSAENDRYEPTVSSDSGGQSSTSGAGTTTLAYTMIDRSFALPSSTTISRIRIYLAAAATVIVKIVQEITTASYSIVASQSVAHPGGGWVSFALSSPFAVPSSGVYRTGLYIAAGGPTTGLPSAVRSYKAGDVTGANQTGFAADTGGVVPVQYEYNIVTQNMTLVSTPYAAQSGAPAAGRLAVQVVETDPVIINTDLIAKMSRDGGTTWATAVLSLSQSLIGPKIYETNNINLSSLPSGTSMKWEIDTANNKNVAISGVVMQWS